MRDATWSDSCLLRLESLRQAVFLGEHTIADAPVSSISEIREHSSGVAAGVPRRVMVASAPFMMKTGEEGHAWREFEHAINKPTPAVTKPLSHQVGCTLLAGLCVSDSEMPRRRCRDGCTIMQ